MSDTWSVRVPASSANLGAGFDVLGMALDLHAEAGVGEPPDERGAAVVDEHHPARIAFERMGGSGPLWVRCPIPGGRGLGFSGAVRVAGAVAALVQRDGLGALDDEARRAVLAITAEMERHADNVAASLFGGVVITIGSTPDITVCRVPLAFNPAVLVWVPGSATTSTDHSRGQLRDQVALADAVHNIACAATFVAACASGDHSLLRAATEDRLHQQQRLAHVPQSAAALQAALEAGVWAAWLSGSGPTIAALCEPSRADEVAAQLPSSGHVKRLRIDHEGVVIQNGDHGESER